MKILTANFVVVKTDKRYVIIVEEKVIVNYKKTKVLHY